MSGLLLAAALWAGPPATESAEAVGKSAPPGFSVSFGFEPRLGSYGARNTRLEEYGYAPVAPLLLTYGLRGRVYGQRGWVFGGAMSYGVSVNEADDNPVPSVLSRIESAFSLGHQLGAGFEASIDLAFAVQTLTVGSEQGGGALLDLGPAVIPRISWAPRRWPPYVRLNAGYALSFAVAPPHSNHLWEDSFQQVIQHAFVFGIEMGYHRGRPLWGWGSQRESR